MTDTKIHWDTAYTTKGETQLSWFQLNPTRSFEWVTAAAADQRASIIDVGGGRSRLADRLLAAGYSDLTVLDVSEVALSSAKARLGASAGKVSWIVSDVTRWTPDRTWDVWHDRAVFHFLTDREDQNAYIRALTRGTVPGSAVIMATFALDGPERCSGLPVQRYSSATLAARLGSDYALYDDAVEQHPTPFGTVQSFSYAAFRRR